MYIECNNAFDSCSISVNIDLCSTLTPSSSGVVTTSSESSSPSSGVVSVTTSTSQTTSSIHTVSSSGQTTSSSLSSSSSSSSTGPSHPTTVNVCGYCDQTCTGASQCRSYQTGQCVEFSRICGNGAGDVLGYGILEYQPLSDTPYSITMYPDSTCQSGTYQYANSTCGTCLGSNVNAFVKCNTASTQSIFTGLIVSSLFLVLLAVL
ncbi:hypothetical protein SAMD00019534_092720 [Acytostelium subglobosum LB1]|uniref:hypothetical protein n=1 Tax=Acytostelium subglobosum LB1 TaxID=1410327 RepID=UPI000644E280|nr:hypothetical protein SAMD00019534_092720 [Acytostelium subglobosum LB1]GAM26097.1 hypothetical protein SAMD00019534_092720 [Acytostelium subglobosum LB1]|eukprot:XP_012751140.1 hypothetical protein SAMD00019534_092720 [Acytostelium subglobosum LB1]